MENLSLLKLKKVVLKRGNMSQVDGITGGTITSDGVSDMLYNTLKIYNNYFSSITIQNDSNTITSYNNIKENEILF